VVPKLSWIKVPLCILGNFHGLAKLGGEGGTRLKRGCGELENILFFLFYLVSPKTGSIIFMVDICKHCS